ncbi:di-heme oxidoredictase family protein [Segatella albensis]|uniref:di-heme oxidoredictase family protein n=1 Tax=Segatella albensis TaxID=77768 RepID=UPI0004006A75|nr:di-heme oxidoredictase family protein [Segatella albensis]
MKQSIYFLSSATVALATLLTGCSDDATGIQTNEMPEANYIGETTGNFSAEEWYPGGKLGTTENIGSSAYSDQTPVVDENPSLFNAFFAGEQMFERNYTENKAPFKGLGPASVRSSCFDCHPQYGHGKWQAQYRTEYANGNGYLLVIYHPNHEGSNDGPYVSEVTAMPQTQASAPFLPPVNENGINIKWEHVTKMESGLPMHFPDGESFDLIYPEVTIAQSAFNTKPQPTNYDVRLESTIGVIGTGLLDAIPNDSIRAQYAKTAGYFKRAGMNVAEYVNSSFWDASANDFTANAWYKAGDRKFVKRFTYALTRGTLQDGPGANAIWNITNVSRPDRPYLYTTSAWAQAMSENPDVITQIKANPSSPYYADGTDAGIADAVRNLLDPKTNQFDNKWHNFTPDQTTEQFYNFMVWHRGLAIPRARNLNDKEVQRGKKLFMEIGCASCHRPSWKTGNDDYWEPEICAGKPLPRYPHQTIYPYSDMMQHKLYMKNDIHGSWCRTTPLWGRGLSLINTGAEDRLHDCRARNEIEAIMWHAYSKNSHAYSSALKFYNLPKSDRDAIVKFLRSI